MCSSIDAAFCSSLPALSQYPSPFIEHRGPPDNDSVKAYQIDCFQTPNLQYTRTPQCKPPSTQSYQNCVKNRYNVVKQVWRPIAHIYVGEKQQATYPQTQTTRRSQNQPYCSQSEITQDFGHHRNGKHTCYHVFPFHANQT